jgi:hypothetical protein
MTDLSNGTPACVLVAIDIAKQWNAAMIEFPDGKRQRFQFKHIHEDYDRLVRLLHSTGSSCRIAQKSAVSVLESSQERTLRVNQSMTRDIRSHEPSGYNSRRRPKLGWVARSLDREATQQIRENGMLGMRPAGVLPAVNGLDSHAEHQEAALRGESAALSFTYPRRVGHTPRNYRLQTDDGDTRICIPFIRRKHLRKSGSPAELLKQFLCLLSSPLCRPLRATSSP